mmetsp:Transcript_44499/g.107218  ORF Transcript_44499/g.107218 Transcript_44499/m.107218 type:complete len:173 (+) Transcript_44499:539-1057(+)
MELSSELNTKSEQSNGTNTTGTLYLPMHSAKFSRLQILRVASLRSNSSLSPAQAASACSSVTKRLIQATSPFTTRIFWMLWESRTMSRHFMKQVAIGYCHSKPNKNLLKSFSGLPSPVDGLLAGYLAFQIQGFGGGVIQTEEFRLVLSGDSVHNHKLGVLAVVGMLEFLDPT